MKIRLGYACITNALDETSSSALTFSHFKKLENNKKGSGYNKLNEVIISNFKSLKNILIYNIKNNVSVYRLSSNIIPLLNHPDVFIDLNKYKEYFLNIGKNINENGIRADIHIDPFYVLNSVSDNVVKSTINICKIYHNMFKLMNIKSNLILHVGGKTISKSDGIKRFINKALASLAKMSKQELADDRYAKFRKIGVFEEEAVKSKKNSKSKKTNTKSRRK